MSGNRGPVSPKDAEVTPASSKLGAGEQKPQPTLESKPINLQKDKPPAYTPPPTGNLITPATRQPDVIPTGTLIDLPTRRPDVISAETLIAALPNQPPQKSAQLPKAPDAGKVIEESIVQAVAKSGPVAIAARLLASIGKIAAALGDKWKLNDTPKRDNDGPYKTFTKGDATISVYPNKFKIDKDDKEGFIALLKAYQATHNDVPSMTANTTVGAKLWKEAFEAVYPGKQANITDLEAKRAQEAQHSTIEAQQPATKKSEEEQYQRPALK